MGAACDGYIPKDTAARVAAGAALRRGTREDLAAALAQVRARTLELAHAWLEQLGTAMEVPLHAWLNPPRWELGHLAWFEQRWIARNPLWREGRRCDPQQPLRPSDRPGADALYDSSAVPHDARWTLELPSFGDTLDWLATTRGATLETLAALPMHAGEDAFYFFRLAALHEAMHAEAACYMADTLGSTATVTAPPDHECLGGSLRVDERRVRIASQGGGFSFDNERQPHDLELCAFEIDADLVSWSRYGEFVDAGGYDDARWWSADGWKWRQHARRVQPRFPRGPAPALHLSAHEADAWCRWAGRRLPTEFEWEGVAQAEPAFTWGHAWEWTATTFGPYPGFEPDPYRDYSLPWFGTRRVLRGASHATPDILVDPHFRNFFEPDRTDIIAGFRSCRSSG